MGLKYSQNTSRQSHDSSNSTRTRLEEGIYGKREKWWRIDFFFSHSKSAYYNPAYQMTTRPHTTVKCETKIEKNKHSQNSAHTNDDTRARLTR